MPDLTSVAGGAAAGSALGPWGAVAGGAIGAVGSLMGASKNAKAASSAQQSQERMAGADLAFRQQQYNRYLGLMGPIEEQLSKEAQSSQPLDYDRNAAAIKQNYANAQRNIGGAMGMRGMAGSGIDMGAMRGAAFGQAGELSNAFSTGLQNRRNLGLSLTGRGQIQNAAGGLMGGMQNMANMYGNQANMYNQGAAMGWQNFGQGLQGMANQYGQNQFNQQRQQQQPPTSFSPAGTYNGASYYQEDGTSPFADIY